MDEKRAVLLVVDIQERLLPVVQRPDGLLDRITFLISACRVLSVPILVTEQSPEKLGPTVEQIRQALGDAYRPLVKASFSPFAGNEFRRSLASLGRHQILLCGIEAHVCVTQAGLDALKMGWEVFLARDAVSSRFEPDTEVSLFRLAASGAHIVTSEMAVYEMIRGADHQHFRSVQDLVKRYAAKR